MLCRAHGLGAHLPTLATRAGLGAMFRSLGIVRFALGGVVKIFRCTALPFRWLTNTISPTTNSLIGLALALRAQNQCCHRQIPVQRVNQRSIQRPLRTLAVGMVARLRAHSPAAQSWPSHVRRVVLTSVATATFGMTMETSKLTTLPSNSFGANTSQMVKSYPLLKSVLFSRRDD